MRVASRKHWYLYLTLSVRVGNLLARGYPQPTPTGLQAGDGFHPSRSRDLTVRFSQFKRHSIGHNVIYLLTDLEATRNIAALSAVAEQWVAGTFVSVDALFARLVSRVAGIADTPVGAVQVLASSVGADAWCLRALVDVCVCVKDSNQRDSWQSWYYYAVMSYN